MDDVGDNEILSGGVMEHLRHTSKALHWQHDWERLALTNFTPPPPKSLREP